MIQDIYPHKFNNQYDPAKEAKPDSPIITFKGRDLLLKGETHLPVCSDLEVQDKPVYLFNVDGVDYYYILPPEEAPSGMTYRRMRDVRYDERIDQVLTFTVMTGYQLVRWYKDNVYCGTCGSRTEHSKTERALSCPSCGRLIYPRIIPAVIVGITNGDEIILTKYAGRDINYYALVAGFTEIGETLEETVEREVMEEVGLKVKNIRYYKSQPWGVADDILAGFFCEVDGDTTIKMDESELKVAQWTKREDIILQPDNFSLTNEMMTVFKEGREK
ncbi:MAG: NAD(+) diphosphatase [Lachnospiraceae bacterium]|nr:NAD(+) diphosphatase [Lachnospiraceae bacterium]